MNFASEQSGTWQEWGLQSPAIEYLRRNQIIKSAAFSLFSGQLKFIFASSLHIYVLVRGVELSPGTDRLDPQLEMDDWEGLLLLMIEFKDSLIGESFYKQMKTSLSEILDRHYNHLTILLNEQEKKSVLCIRGMELLEPEEKKAVVTVMTNVTIAQYLPLWMADWLRTLFYYDDDHEIQSIIHTAKGMFFSPQQAQVNRLSVSFLQWQQTIYQKLEPFIEKNISFSFDSFIYFRLQSCKEKLLDVIETAIDEYRMELDYQFMLNQCREMLKTRKPRVRTVFVSLSNGIEFFDESGELISIHQIYQWLDTVTSFERSLPIHERLIGPLVSMAPEKIVMYSNECDDDLYHTLKNIFEERLALDGTGMGINQSIEKRKSFPS